MPQGAIVLMQRGGCGDFTKYLNAQAAGAGATIFINEGKPRRHRSDPCSS